MKSKDYIHLVTIGEAEAKMIQELLWKQKIPSELHPSFIADALAGQAVHGNLPYQMRVPKESLEKARELLNLKEPSK